MLGVSAREDRLAHSLRGSFGLPAGPQEEQDQDGIFIVSHCSAGTEVLQHVVRLTVSSGSCAEARAALGTKDTSPASREPRGGAGAVPARGRRGPDCRVRGGRRALTERDQPPPPPRLTTGPEDLTKHDSEPTSVHGCGPTIRSLRAVEDGEVSSPRDNVQTEKTQVTAVSPAPAAAAPAPSRSRVGSAPRRGRGAETLAQRCPADTLWARLGPPQKWAVSGTETYLSPPFLESLTQDSSCRDAAPSERDLLSQLPYSEAECPLSASRHNTTLGQRRLRAWETVTGVGTLLKAAWAASAETEFSASCRRTPSPAPVTQVLR
ncbi:unnamed protein product [Rangifer tarandus platyrhynchus]|uniref:Uncharacterized protein n=1 Tax=Rangifer tarandus platyrhynchus TaxID=3082113 RepID=A0AC60A4T4_RANTA